MMVNTDQTVTLLGPVPLKPQNIDHFLTIAPILVAADSGARQALEMGHIPAAVIGDMDSLPHSARERIPVDRIRKIDEQETTDFEKSLQLIKAPMILALGFMGGRTDHELAVYHGLLRCADARCIVVGPEDIVFAAPPRLRLDARSGDRLSLFPLVPVTGSSEGLEWPIAGIDFAPGRRIGTSNRAVGPVILEFDQPGMLVILPLSALEAACTALSQAPSWPAPSTG